MGGHTVSMMEHTTKSVEILLEPLLVTWPLGWIPSGRYLCEWGWLKINSLLHVDPVNIPICAMVVTSRPTEAVHVVVHGGSPSRCHTAQMSCEMVIRPSCVGTGSQTDTRSSCIPLIEAISHTVR